MKNKLSFARSVVQEHKDLIRITSMNDLVKKTLIEDCEKIKSVLEGLEKDAKIYEARHSA